MRLLIVTQKVDREDPILGFFHRWIEEFAKRAESIIVICLEEGVHSLPPHVRVLSLGKERGVSRLGYIMKFYRYILKERKNYDAVFVHMNPEYVVLAGDLWRIVGKKVALWYTHREKNLKLRLAASIADVIFTASKESFTLASSKVQYVGHGIDTDKFSGIEAPRFEPLVMSHVGRVTPIKHIEVMIEALAILAAQGVDACLRLVGEPVTESDAAYKEKLIALATERGVLEKVVWVGAMDNVRAFTEASITLNAAPDGGMDKAVLESLSAGRAVFVSNRAFKELFGSYWDMFSYAHEDHEALAAKIKQFIMEPSTYFITTELLERVSREYTTQAVIQKISDELQKHTAS